MVQQGNTAPFVAPAEVRFLVDRMLGRLAKWLRIIGYDALYVRHLSPLGLLREARRQGRIVLTRDTRVARQRDAPPFLIVRSDRFREQLREVIDALALDPYGRLLTRCVECNRLLEGADKGAVKARVPAYVWETQERFFRCPGCERVYWGATHREHILRELKEVAVVGHA